MPDRSDIFAVTIGFCGGLASGLLGVGGGIVMVPGLVIFARIAQRRAHATSLAAIIPIGIVGAALYAWMDRIDYGLAALIAVGSIFGAPFGVKMLHRAPDWALRSLFAAVSLAAGVKLVLA